ncbi:uncharacterized protein KQ657_002549 [Scheffersomyces spartinae]|uniref:Uncharacterized protein n=1 Tax=Scheffersomyces spartinae TaxID=45513 RepID=A0A9P7V624_9ASCO|nr:uncharacterized protein KQ657_002549 [Scheffersomyces spartinae]KAG7191943.1 hypothetical protein KQ657_002549 [Scheffersomyces spartinae]
MAGYPGYYWGVGKNKKKSPKKKETLPSQPYDSVILDLNKQIKEVNKKIQGEFKKTGVKLDDNHPLIVKQKELLTAKAARREEINKKTNDNERQEGKELDEWILVKNDI